VQDKAQAGVCLCVVSAMDGVIFIFCPMIKNVKKAEAVFTPAFLHSIIF
jgi:hypothetical protein